MCMVCVAWGAWVLHVVHALHASDAPDEVHQGMEAMHQDGAVPLALYREEA